MVLDFYNLAEQPFGVTPDPHYLYLSATHREALASLLYGLEAGRGFMALIAKPGMGKTTLLFEFLETLRNSCRTVFLFQFQGDHRDVLRSLLADLGVEDDGADLVRLHKKLNDTLLSSYRQGRRVVVVIDEAQNLDDQVLEAVRMLSNFETPHKKLMHLILAGQPLLAEKLAAPGATQLRERISIFARLKPFDRQEVERYIDHRLRVAGYDLARALFTKRALALIAAHSGGIPRNISNICFNSMSLGFAMQRRLIDESIVQEVLEDLDLRPLIGNETRLSRLEEATAPALSAAPTAHAWAVPPKWKQALVLSFALFILLFWSFTPGTKHMAERILNRTARADRTAKTTSLVAGLPPAVRDQGRTTSRRVAPARAPRSVTVRPNETLSQISVREIGKYDNLIQAQFQKSNPWLVDPDYIMSGQTIEVPSPSSASEANRSAGEQMPSIFAAKADKR
jgi:type II secretory pathway predicted ATPase ExeA